MGVLNSKSRKKLPAADFAIPSKREYPIEDKSHAQNALARVEQFGSPAIIAKVKSAVYSKYPELKHMKNK